MMSTAVTVPPYNSSDYDYIVTVAASHIYQYLPGKQFSDEAHVRVEVLVRYLSSDTSIERNFEGHHTCTNFKFPVGKLFSNYGTPSSLSWDIISLMVDMMNIPFPLEKLHWREFKDGVRGPTTPLMNQDDMIKNILDYVRRMNTGTPKYTPLNKQGCYARPVEVRIEKKVTLPHHEFEAWTTWANEQKRVDGVKFEEEYREVITEQPLRELRVLSSAIRDVAADMLSPGKALEKVKFEGGGSGDHEQRCSICIEEFLIGSEVSRMPCGHLYHEDCILNWLKKNQGCPYCRFKLLSMGDILDIQVGFHGWLY